MNIKYIFTMLALLPGLWLQAQETKPISLSEAVQLVKENNREIKISQQEFLESRGDYRQTNSIFLPNVAVSHTGMTTTNPLMAFGSKLNQEIVTQSDFNPDFLNNPERINNFATKIEVEQPLINLDGIYQRKAAKKKMDATALQTDRTINHMVLEVEKAYMQLQLAHQAVTVLESAQKAALANKKLADDIYKQGYLQRSDVLSVEIRVSEVNNQLQYAKSNVINASDYLAYLLNEPVNIIFEPTDPLEVSIPVQENIETVSKDRADIRAMELATEAYGEMLQADKMFFLPRLNAFGSYELYDNEIFSGDASGYLAGIQLKWDLFEGYKRFGKLQKSKATYEKARLEYDSYVSKSEMERNRASRAVKDAENKLNLTRLALEQAEESLRIRSNRFEQGLEKTSDLLTAEAQYSQKQLEYAQTIFEYNYAQAQLDFLIK
ncbi:MULTISPECIES: TolC family protein [Salegentibacter]|jgi:outer membrane protein TolC|uniref:Outer membrane protein TolC n=1 Tax=Salegentibacter agarivorans TaxID=345907 RepID=A0A1I2N0L4_9FLAO|nr:MULTISPECIES: TolC family protein [Salegentibacter]APS38970.1 transporter [Salegentibacter sp. T436]SFF97213.1 Outer membrane protein TolC [Salegentibacter agarivorans]